MKYYYTNAQNQPTGPVEIDELRTLLAAGTVKPSTYVIPVGGTDWSALSALLAANPVLAPVPSEAPAPLVAPNVAESPQVPVVEEAKAAAPTQEAAASVRVQPRSKQTPAPVEAAPAPVEQAPVPVQAASAPVQQTPAPVQAASAPVQQAPVPVQAASAAPVSSAAPATPVSPAASADSPAPVSPAASAAPSVPTASVSPGPLGQAGGGEGKSEAVKGGVSPTPAPEQTRSGGPGFTVRISTVLADSVAGLIELARRVLTEKLLRSILGFCRDQGQLLILVGALLGLVYSMIYAIKYERAQIFGMGVIGVLVIALLQFVSKRFFEGCANLLRSTRSTMASAAVLDCVALIALLVSLATVVLGFVSAIQFRQVSPLIGGLATSFIFLMLGGVALQRSLLNLEIAPATAGEEAMGVLACLIKLPVALVPIYFFILALAGVALAIAGIFNGDLSLPIPGLNAIRTPLDNVAGLGVLVAASLLPFVTYLLFLLSYLAVDVIRSIVCIPAKLDALRQEKS